MLILSKRALNESALFLSYRKYKLLRSLYFPFLTHKCNYGFAVALKGWAIAEFSLKVDIKIFRQGGAKNLIHGAVLNKVGAKSLICGAI
ncbi:MAG: hypothetical protein K0S51_2221 [Bacillales bacterium]|jgi:hypothetical protein|nr:hypothetical protein [Bacillales bacterium]